MTFQSDAPSPPSRPYAVEAQYLYQLAKSAAGVDTNRTALTCIHFRPDGWIEAADGFVLMAVPPLFNRRPADPSLHGLLVPVKSKKGEPPAEFVEWLRRQKTTALEVRRIEDDEAGFPQVQFWTGTNSFTVQARERRTPETPHEDYARSFHYPDTTELWSATKPTTIRFSRELLLQLLRNDPRTTKNANPAISFYFHHPLQIVGEVTSNPVLAVEYSLGDARGLIMPMFDGYNRPADPAWVPWAERPVLQAEDQAEEEVSDVAQS